MERWTRERMEFREIPRVHKVTRKGQLEAPGGFSPRPMAHANDLLCLKHNLDFAKSRCLPTGHERLEASSPLRNSSINCDTVKNNN